MEEIEEVVAICEDEESVESLYDLFYFRYSL